MRLHSAALHLLRTLRKRDAGMGLSPTRASVLSVLVFGGPRTLKQLTAIEQVAAPTMSKLVNGLERDGLVRRIGDRADGRSWVIQATARARRLLLRGRQARLDLLLQLLSGTTAEEWHTLEQASSIMERALRQR